MIVNEGTGFDDLADLSGRKSGRKSRMPGFKGRKTRAHGAPAMLTRQMQPHQMQPHREVMAPTPAPGWAPEIPVREAVEEGYEVKAQEEYAEGLDDFADDEDDLDGFGQYSDESVAEMDEDYYELSEDEGDLDQFGDPMGYLGGRKRKSKAAPPPGPAPTPPGGAFPMMPGTPGAPGASTIALQSGDGGGFMSYLPWILGGALVIGGGVFLYFAMTAKSKRK